MGPLNSHRSNRSAMFFGNFYNTTTMTRDKSDPTKDPKFQKVVRHFLETPPRPHKADQAKKSNRKQGKRKSGSTSLGR